MKLAAMDMIFQKIINQPLEENLLAPCLLIGSRLRCMGE